MAYTDEYVKEACYAVKDGDVVTLGALLKKYPTIANAAYYGPPLLHYALSSGSVVCVELLLELGADPNLCDDKVGSCTPMWRFLSYVSNYEGGGAEAAHVARRLIGAGADLSAHVMWYRTQTPLEYARERNAAKEVIEVLEEYEKRRLK